MTGRIFISYRRADSQYATDRIYERLEAHFGSENVFMDIDDIPLGVNFRVYIDHQVSTSDIVLAVIGDHWLDSTDPEGNPRLHNPSDFVRLELEAALKQGIKLIPLFIGGVQAVPASKLPESLQELPMLNAIRIRRGKDFLPDVDRLISGIERINAEQAAQREQNKLALAELKDSATEVINRLSAFEALMIQEMRKRTQLEREAQKLQDQVREHLGDPKKQLRVNVGFFREQVEKLQDNLMELALQIEERKQAKDYEEQRSAAQKLAEEREERDRIAKEIAEKERKAKEIAKADRIAKEKSERERVAKKIAEDERKAKEIAETDRIAKQKAEADRKAREKREAEKQAKAQAEAEQKAKQKAARAVQRREQIAQLKALVARVPVWGWVAVGFILLGAIIGPMVWNGITSIMLPSQTPDFVRSLQAYIDENPPYFEDDFSTIKDASWSHVLFDNSSADENLENYIQGGYLLVNHIDADSWGEINLGDLEGNSPLIGTDFVLELNVIPTKMEDANAMFVVYFRSIETMRQNIFGINETDWIVMYEDMDESGEIASGQSGLFKVGETNQIQIFAQGDQVAFYVNGELLTQVQHSQIVGARNNFGFAVGEGKFQGGIDNVRFWSLDAEKPQIVEDSDDNDESGQVLAGFADQIITSKPAGYRDGFDDSGRSYWLQQMTPGIRVIDFVSSGKLSMEASPENLTSYSFSPLPVNLSDFILQFDITPQQFIEDSVLVVEFRSTTNHAYKFRLFPFANWDLVIDEEGQITELESGNFGQLPAGKTKTIRLVVLFDEIAVSVNEEIIGYVRDETIDQGEFIIAVEASSPFRIDLDDIAVWDLSGEVEMEEYQQYYFPANEMAFANSVLTFIDETLPNFAEDFQAIQPYMYEQPVYQDEQQDIAMHEVVVDGALRLDSANESMAGDQGWNFNFVETGAENIALQFDFAIPENASNVDIIIIKSPPDMNKSYNSHLGLTSEGTGFGVREEAPESSLELLFMGFPPVQDFPQDWEETHTLLLIFYDSQFAALLDGNFLGYLEGLEFSIDQEIFFNVQASGGTIVELDNIKFWNLDGIEIGQDEPQVEEQAFDHEYTLAFIEEELQPTFEDSFEQKNDVWGTNSEGRWVWSLLENEALNMVDFPGDDVWSGEEEDNNIGVTFPTNGLFDASNFLLQFTYQRDDLYDQDLTIEFRSQQDQGYELILRKDNDKEGLFVLQEETVISDGTFRDRFPTTDVKLLVVDNYLRFFIDNEFVYGFDELVLKGTSNQINLKGNSMVFDDFLFWNLDGVEIN